MEKLKINYENRERVKIAKKMGKPDQVGIDFSLGDQFNYLHGWLGLDGIRYWLDPAYQLEAQIKFINKFGVEGVLGPNFAMGDAGTYFGSKAIVRKDTSPWVEPHLTDPQKLEEYMKNEKMPDPYLCGNFPLFSNAYSYFKNELGDLIDAPMGVLGPIDMACSTCGSTNFFIMSKTHPELILSFLERISEFLKKHLQVRAEIFKPEDNDYLGIYDDYAGFFAKDDFLKFAFPFIKDIYDSYTSKDAIREFHCDATISHLVELIPEMGVNVLLSFDPTTDISVFKEKIGDRVCLKGNVHPIKIMINGTPDQVKNEVKRQLGIAKKGGGYIMCTGGELGDGTPDENIFALIEAVEEYGKY